ncbi:MAG: YHS domain-containing protein [Candidatus Electrothrix communis]|nr:MAG: YHS domain-containing protein [Candidatus Electrothrix communis]
MRILKTFSLASLCLLMLLSFAGNVFAVPQTKCPVMGGDINKEIYADHEGKRVYFCCAACLPQFQENPEEYLAKMEKAGVEPGAVPAETGDVAPDQPADNEGHSGHTK